MTHRVTKNDNEWQRMLQLVTKGDNECQQVITNNNEWQQVVSLANFAFSEEERKLPLSTLKTLKGPWKGTVELRTEQSP